MQTLVHKASDTAKTRKYDANVDADDNETRIKNNMSPSL